MHCDGKLLSDLLRKENVDANGTGIYQAKAVMSAVEQCVARYKIVFDTTSVNTGCRRDTGIFLEQLFQ